MKKFYVPARAEQRNIICPSLMNKNIYSRRIEKYILEGNEERSNG